MEQTQKSLMIRIPSQDSLKSRGTPKAPKAPRTKPKKTESKITNLEDEVMCSAGCGMTCDPNDHVGGFCSRDCFMEVYRSSYLDYE